MILVRYGGHERPPFTMIAVGGGVYSRPNASGSCEGPAGSTCVTAGLACEVAGEVGFESGERIGAALQDHYLNRLPLHPDGLIEQTRLRVGHGQGLEAARVRTGAQGATGEIDSTFSVPHFLIFGRCAGLGKRRLISFPQIQQ